MKIVIFSFNPYLFMIFFMYFNIHHDENKCPKCLQEWIFLIFFFLFYLFFFFFLTTSSLVESRGGGAGAISLQYPWAKYRAYLGSALTGTSQHTFHLFIRNRHHPGLEPERTELSLPYFWVVPTRTRSTRTILHLALFLGRFNMPLCRGVGYRKTRQPEQVSSSCR